LLEWWIAHAPNINMIEQTVFCYFINNRTFIHAQILLDHAYRLPVWAEDPTKQKKPFIMHAIEHDDQQLIEFLLRNGVDLSISFNGESIFNYIDSNIHRLNKTNKLLFSLRQQPHQALLMSHQEQPKDIKKKRSFF
jgi:hypothetical protein